jgi:hypothetical protein
VSLPPCCVNAEPLQVQAESAAAGPPRRQLAQLLVDALSARQGSAARTQGLAALADALDLNPDDRARLGLNPAAAGTAAGSTAAAGLGDYGASTTSSSMAAGAGAAAAAEHGYGYGAAADITPPRDAVGGGGGRGRRGVLGRVVGALFGGGREGQQGERGLRVGGGRAVREGVLACILGGVSDQLPSCNMSMAANRCCCDQGYVSSGDPVHPCAPQHEVISVHEAK